MLADMAMETFSENLGDSFNDGFSVVFANYETDFEKRDNPHRY
jgi:hypothetical protein